MTQVRIALTSMCLAAVVAAGCAGSGNRATIVGPSPGGEGRLEVALGGDWLPGSSAFRIRLYKTTPDSLARKPYFQSGCTPPNFGFTVTDLDVGSDYTVVYEAFSTGTCQDGTVIARGIRGNVDVSKAGTGNAVYYIQVNLIGAISAFPVPEPALVDSGVACREDAECQDTIPCDDPANCRFPIQEACAAEEQCADGVKWMQYRVHPAARCADGLCTLDSLFPLNAKANRLFPVTASGPTGDVLITGGFDQVGGTGLNAGFLPPETFGSGTSLFYSFDEAAAEHRALAGAAILSGPQQEPLLAVIGGSPAVGVEVDGDAKVPLPRPQLCTGECPIQLSDAMAITNLETGERTAVMFPVATAMPLVEPMAGDAGPGTEAFVRTGLVQPAADRIEAGRASYRCILDERLVPACVIVAGSENAVARYAAASACVSRDAAGCTDVVVLGGNTVADSASFAELYWAGDHQVRGLTPQAGVPQTMFGAIAVVVGGQVWTFGGTSGGDARHADLEPYGFNVDPRAGTISAATSGLSGGDLELMIRTHHQVTPMADGRTVLVTGGLDRDRKPLASAVLVQAADGRLTIASVLNDLSSPRVGHGAVRIQGGLMDGAVLITGGLRVLRGTPEFASGAEIFVP